jgi:membrane associated rhomboid family serine protease
MSRDAFLYWWPVLARLAGVLGAFGQAAYAVVSHQAADVAFLGFCGALIAAPTIFPADPLPRKGDAREGENSA